MRNQHDILKTAVADISKGQTDMSYKSELQTLTKLSMRHQVCHSETCQALVLPIFDYCDVVQEATKQGSTFRVQKPRNWYAAQCKVAQCQTQTWSTHRHINLIMSWHHLIWQVYCTMTSQSTVMKQDALLMGTSVYLMHNWKPSKGHFKTEVLISGISSLYCPKCSLIKFIQINMFCFYCSTLVFNNEYLVSMSHSSQILVMNQDVYYIISLFSHLFNIIL